MRCIIIPALAFSFYVVAVAWAERTQVEIVKATTPEDDNKPNDPAIPEAMAVSGQFERIFVFRFKYQTDLLGGIEDLVKQYGIKNAVILSGIGSVRNYHVHAVSNRTFPSENVYTKDDLTPADIVSINGYVFEGRVHAHLTLADAQQAFGGHLEPATNVFTFAIVTLAELSTNMDISRFDDKTVR